jgi:hypothetical protein
LIPQFRDGDDSDSSHDDLGFSSVRKTWDQVHRYDDHLFFGTYNSDIDLSPLHPSSIQIVRLFQIFVENVNPILKLVHVPTLQARIIEAAANPRVIVRELEALMFSIYCMSITTLTDAECQSMFESPKQTLRAAYQFGCQQAIAKCEFLRTSDRDCLTALYLYLVQPPL